jgi:hypothetical protein
MYKCCCLSRLVGNIVDCIICCFTSCLVSNDLQYTFILGKQDSATWKDAVGPGTYPTLSYSYMGAEGPKQVEVTLKCAEGADNTVVAIGEGPQGFYKFELTGKCACGNGCKGELF